MATNYPSNYDIFPVPTAADKVNGAKRHSELHRDMGDAIEAIQAILGTNPQGASSTVKQRLDLIETKLLSTPVPTNQLEDLAVTTGKIADSAVTGTKIAVDSITNAKMADNAINTAEIIDSAVTTSKLNDLAVTGNKLATDSVTNIKIVDGTIQYAKLNADVKNTLIVSASYTPTLTNVTVGTGGSENTASYVWIGGPSVGDVGFLYLNGRIILGTTGSSVTGQPTASLPSGFNALNTLSSRIWGESYLFDASTNADRKAAVFGSSATQLRLCLLGGDSATITATSATSPWTWASLDQIIWQACLPAIRV